MPSLTLSSDPRVQIMSVIGTPLYLFDINAMAIAWANDSAVSYWEATSADELCDRDMHSNMTSTARNRLQQVTQACFDTNGPVIEHWTIYPDQRPKSSNFQISPFYSSSGERLLLIQVLGSDISEQSRTENAYSTSALMHTSAMISVYDTDSKLVYCNAAARASMPETVSSSQQRLVHKADVESITRALAKHDHHEIEAQVNTVDGLRWHTLRIQRSINPISAKVMYLVTETDDTEQHIIREEAHRLAYIDSLTSLPNRAALSKDLKKIMDDHTTTHYGVLFLDLDRFKIINDSLGHSAGDQLLIRVAQRLQKAVGTDGLVYRLGGDEFFVLTPQITDHARLTRIAEQILTTMAPPLAVSGHKLRALPSIGICTYPQDANSPGKLMQNADTAMYMAKANQCGYRFYDAEKSTSISEDIKDRMNIESDMVAALENEEFELFYQPKIDCQTMAVVGVEALIRWHHPQRGTVPPDKFISIAEDTGQIVEIGRWVLSAGMHQQQLWRQEGLAIPVSINISPRQFLANNLLKDVSSALQETGSDAHMIELEITESMLIGEPDAVSETLHRLSAIGIRLALDDFGTGFANLDCLQKYPLDCMKIDRIFLSDRKRSMLMSTILKMGKVLGLEVVAEGVETHTQIDWLIANGCDLMQGFYFSRPLPANKITQYLIDNGAPRNGIGTAA